MACRVGMSTTPYTRINYWKETEGHTYGKILASGLTYRQALELEKEEAAARGCRASGGGPRKSGKVWSVYYVSGGR